MNIFKLFSKGKKKSKFPLSKEEQQWIEEDFSMIIDDFGYPKSDYEQVVFNKAFFPNTFSNKTIEVQNLIDDLCVLLGLDIGKITYEFFEEIHDTRGLPMAYEGEFLFAETKIELGKYHIYINKQNLKIPNRLIYGLLREFIKIRFLEYNPEFEMINNSDILIFLGGLYFGLGVLLAQFMTDVGYVTEGEWETKWMTVSPFSYETLAFCLGLFSILTNEEHPKWENELSKDLKSLVDKAKVYLSENPSGIIDKNEIESRSNEKEANSYYEKNDFEKAILYYDKVLTQSKDEYLIFETNNNIGYSYSRLGEFEKSKIYFNRALNIFPKYGFALDNLGYSFLMTGLLEESLAKIKEARLSGSNMESYTFRNYAVYYLKSNNYERAEHYFQKAFSLVEEPVDLLNYHYADFLFLQNKIEEGKVYLQKSVEQGEPEGIHRMSEMN